MSLLSVYTMSSRICRDHVSGMSCAPDLTHSETIYCAIRTDRQAVMRGTAS